LTQEQQQFADALRRWVDKDYSFETRKRIIHRPAGCRTAWDTLVELGMTACRCRKRRAASRHGGRHAGGDAGTGPRPGGRAVLCHRVGAKFLQLAGNQHHRLEDVAQGG
jgi:hypothetical protein